MVGGSLIKQNIVSISYSSYFGNMVIYLHGNDTTRDELSMLPRRKMPTPYPHQVIKRKLEDQATLRHNLKTNKNTVYWSILLFLYKLYYLVWDVLKYTCYTQIGLSVEL